jgi:hypothetical protein
MFDQFEQNYQKGRQGGGQRSSKPKRAPPPPVEHWQEIQKPAPPVSPRITQAVAAPLSTGGLGGGSTSNEIPMDAEGELISCGNCGKSFAPPTYKKLCETLGKDGQPKCIAMFKKKRKVFNSAKVRIQGNEHLDRDAQKLAIAARKEVVKEQKGLKPKPKKKSDKWKEESNNFRQAMRDNRLMEKAKKEGKPLTYYLD